MAAVLLLACGGGDGPPGEIEGAPRPAAALAAEAQAQDAARQKLARAVGAKRQAEPKQILFGDLHAQGRHGVEFYTETKVVVERWLKDWDRKF